jgi:hypothetical protein
MYSFETFQILEKRNKYQENKKSLHLSRKISDKMKELIEPLMNTGSKVKTGFVTGLKKPEGLSKKMSGVGLGADDDGFFVYTHRAASKRYASPDEIPEKDIKWIESTG